MLDFRIVIADAREGYMAENMLNKAKEEQNLQEMRTVKQEDVDTVSQD